MSDMDSGTAGDDSTTADSGATGSSADAATPTTPETTTNSDASSEASNPTASDQPDAQALAEAGATTGDVDAATSQGVDAGETDVANDGGTRAFDSQLPPTDPDLMEAWLAEEFYKSWVCETEASSKTDGAPAIHVHGKATRVCSNIRLAANGAPDADDELPSGVASVKEVYDETAKLVARLVAVKSESKSDQGNGWYWYASPSLEGFGIAECTGCHSAAGSDADHPGLGDFTYFQVTDQADLPPIGAIRAQAWLYQKAYADWTCEDEPSDKTFGAAAIHVHGRNRICSNARLATAQMNGGQWPAGAAAVKELYEPGDAGAMTGALLYLKVAADSQGGDGWYWYAGAEAEGFGEAACTGCHSVAGSDEAHAGAGDFVYARQTQ
ncbi:MAG TPA: hypothetical protein VHM25_04630 [Polyangiaceae bacterium]|nr:hypothetical protein [Polyangiaceae bacterium]